MSNEDKLKTILKNVINKCDGNIFYRILIDGEESNLYKSGDYHVIDKDNGMRFFVDDIENVDFDDDIHFAVFNIKNGYNNVSLDIVKDMSPQEIMTELA